MTRGVVEGFYGRPYTAVQRERIIRSLSTLDQPVYMYAPKNDPFHRLRWSEEYPADHWAALESGMRVAQSSGVDFIFGISPWCFQPGQWESALSKVLQALDAGASGICILFDDIPQETGADLARLQLEFAGGVFEGLHCGKYLCPSIYCVELMDRLDGEEYLEGWRTGLPDGISVLWTGDSVISRQIGGRSIEIARALLGCDPVIWDNLLADDYTLRRIFLADIDDRIPSDTGYLLNPSSCFPVALHGVRALVRACGKDWDPVPELEEHCTAWEVLSMFHWDPWSTGPGARELMSSMLTAAWDSDSPEVLNELVRMESVLGEFVEEVHDIQGGFDLMPYIQDLRKLLGWWRRTLELPGLEERRKYLKYMMMKRLPFDHPLAEMSLEYVSQRTERR